MKFTNGYWMLRDGVQASYPVEVLDVVTAPGSLSVYAPTQPIRHRGDLLKDPVVTLTYSSPMPDVIGVTITHFASEAPREPRFRLQEESADIVVSADDKAAVLTSGGPKTTAIMETDDGRHYIREQLDLGEVAAVFTTTRDGDVVRVTAQGAGAWRLLLVGVRSASAEGGTTSEHEHGVLVEADGDAVTVRGIS